MYFSVLAIFFTVQIVCFNKYWSSVIQRRLLFDRLNLMDLSKFPLQDVLTAKAMPKVELHLHLDGSLSPQFIATRAYIRGIQLPAPPEKLRDFLMEKKVEKLKQDNNRAEKGGNWPVFDFCNQFLQTKEELKQGTLDLLDRLAEENVVYAEIRFCPHLHTREGLSVDEVIASVIAGARSQTRVKTGIILVALRSKDAEHGVEIAQLASKYRETDGGGAAVVGMDIAGDEGTYPLSSSNHSMAAGVSKAMQLAVPLTIHAGEWPESFGSVDNLRWAIENGARRIGHGIAVRSDEQSVKMLKEKNITVEVCLTSNIGNGFKVKNYSEHPVKILQAQGVKFSLSSDNLLLSGDAKFAPSPTAELLHLVHDVGLGWQSARESVVNGLKAALSASVDQKFIDEIVAKMNSIV